MEKFRFALIVVMALLASTVHAGNIQPKGLMIEGVTMVSLNPVRGQVINLAVGVGKTINYSPGTNYLVINCTDHVWFDPNGNSTLTVPTTDNTAGTGPILDPFGFLLDVTGLTSSGIVASAPCQCSITEYKDIKYY